MADANERSGEDALSRLTYVKDMLPQLRALACGSEPSFLAYLFDMTRSELDAEIRRVSGEEEGRRRRTG